MTRRITALNNTGIQNLHQGFFAEAVRSFRMAVACLTDNNNNNNNNNATNASTTTRDDTNKKLLPVSRQHLECIHASTILESSPYNSFEVCQATLIFPRMDSLANFRAEVSIVLAWNLGLTYHFWGLAQSEGSQRNLQQALELYKFVMATLESAQELALKNGIWALALGLLANMGHIFTHFWCIAQAKACIERMEQVLNSTSAVWELCPEDEEFFVSVVAFASAQHFTTAPAA